MKKDSDISESLRAIDGARTRRSRPWQGRALPTTPLSHRAGDGNRTHVASLEGWCSTIELHPHIFYFAKEFWNLRIPESDRRGSNPRSRPWQGRALPTTPLSHKAGDGNRTHVSSLEGWCSTIELHPRVSVASTLISI